MKAIHNCKFLTHQLFIHSLVIGKFVYLFWLAVRKQQEPRLSPEISGLLYLWLKSIYLYPLVLCSSVKSNHTQNPQFLLRILLKADKTYDMSGLTQILTHDQTH